MRLRYSETTNFASKKMNLAYGGAVAGLGLVIAGLGMRKSGKKPKTVIPDYLKPLVPISGEETIMVLSMDSNWAELCDRASEFYILAKDEFKELVKAIAGVVAFQLSLQVNGKSISLGTPRVFRTKLHAVVEAVRLLRAGVEEKCPSAIDDFDEIAADIQRAHDDAAYNIQLECGSLL